MALDKIYFEDVLNKCLKPVYNLKGTILIFMTILSREEHRTLCQVPYTQPPHHEGR